ncbi:MAG: NAD(P)H-dependent oxidoreductase [Thermodesulfobacteriota bacterium]
MPTLTKARQIFLYIAPFPALAFFKIWASLGRDPGSLLIAACAMLVYCVCILILARRWDKPTYFDWAIFGYFLVISFSLALWPQAAGAILTEYAVTGIYVTLFAAAFVPPMLGLDPFTYHYAKKYTPQAVWGNPIFVRINQIMTLIWAGIFATCIVLSIYPSVVTRALIPIAIIVGFGVPLNLRFPDLYLKRIGLPGLAEMRKMSLTAAGETPPIANSDAVSQLAAAKLESVSLTSALNASTGAVGPTYQTQPEKQETAMKVLAINSSPRRDGVSKTALMLDALVNGMRGAGAEVETIWLREKTVKNCIGCFTCWTKTPGVCVQKDDMTNELFPKWLEADIAVFATPLYHFTVNATMKAFIERTLPIAEPFLLRRDGKTYHPRRYDPPKSVVLSVAGFPEMSVFAQLSSYVNFLFGKGLIAEIYRPSAESMNRPELAAAAKEILEATTQAGRELVQSSKISEATMERITKPLVDDFDAFAKMANAFWKTCIREGVTPQEFSRKNMMPRPDSIDTFMMIMPMGFNAEYAAKTKAVIQFRFTGEVEGSCYFRIEDGKIEAAAGDSDKPDLVVESPFDIWMDIMTGKADGQQMFMQQKYRTTGDLSLLMRMKDLFGKGKKSA